MPIHDWGRVKAGIFHDFHHALVEQVKRDLNAGILPAGYYAMVEPTEREPDQRSQSRVSIRHVSGHRVVAAVEIISPGNRSTRQAIEQFTRTAADFLKHGIHLLVIDLIPPGIFDLNGIHGAIWEYVARDDEYSPPTDKPLTVVAYEANRDICAYLEPVTVGDPLPDMPLFLGPAEWVPVPLERSYQTTWDTLAVPIKELFQGQA
jgi:hypothetical protein